MAIKQNCSITKQARLKTFGNVMFSGLGMSSLVDDSTDKKIQGGLSYQDKLRVPMYQIGNPS